MKHGVHGFDVCKYLSDKAERAKQEDIGEGIIKERDIAAYLVRRVTEIGGICRKVAWEGRSDAPDYLVMCGGIHIFVETKAPGKKPRPSQLREFGAMSQHGGLAVIIVSNFSDVDSLIDGIRTCQHLPPAPINL